MLQITYTKLLSQEPVSDNIYKATLGMYYNGACDCYSNCYCYEKKDTLYKTVEKYFHKLKPYTGPLADQFGYKLYDTFQAALNSYNAYLTNLNKTK